MVIDELIKAAFLSLVGSFRAALKLSLIPFGLAAAAFVAINFSALRKIYGSTLGGLWVTHSEARTLTTSALLLVFAGFVVAVLWHRQRAGMPVRFSMGRLIVYMIYSVGITIVALLAALLAVVIPGLILLGYANVQIGEFRWAFQNGWSAVALNGLGNLIFFYVFLRFAPGLVARALNLPLSVGSWHLTEKLGRNCWRISIFATAVILLWSATHLIAIPEIPRALVSLVFNWFAFMMSISILSEVYHASLPSKTSGSSGPPGGPERAPKKRVELPSAWVPPGR